MKIIFNKKIKEIIIIKFYLKNTLMWVYWKGVAALTYFRY
jgi:hypothetical protein